MKLTKENFIYFLRENYNDHIEENKDIEDSTLVQDFSGQGDDAIEFLEILGEKFLISFVDFDFSKYFFLESDVGGYGIVKALFYKLLHRGKEYENKYKKDALTVLQLYEYMEAKAKENK